MDDLVEWLRARLDEDASWGAGDLGMYCDGGVHLSDERWRAEVEAKRRILGWASSPALPEHEIFYVLTALALPYADQPGYRDEWRTA